MDYFQKKIEQSENESNNNSNNTNEGLCMKALKRK